MINCLIVDDEPLAREVIRLHISRLQGWHVVEECKTAMEALEVLINQKIDLIFLDIQMPKIQGTDFLRSLKDPPKIVFTTAFADYAVQGFELNAVDYLLKPITFERFAQAAAKVEAALDPAAVKTPVPAGRQNPVESDDYIFIKQDNRQIKVLFNDILFLEARRDFTMIQLKDKKLLAGFHLKMLEGMLPAAQFMRVHRSYIVRLKAVDVVYGNTLELQGFQVPVSAAHKEALTAALKL
jgi:two-component system LytT family response regulator